MEVVVFGDVHGNLIALEQLFKLEANQSDLFVSHGDIVNYGPWSNECVQYLNSISNCINIKGNHEDNYIKGEYKGTNEVANAFFNFCFPNFNPKLIDEINNYKDSYVLNDYIIKHTIQNQYIFLDTDLENIEINSNFIFGHSHQQFERKKDNFNLINTGSLGQNRSYINQSCYVKINTETNKVELKSFIHDVDKVINQMKIDKYPEICINYYLSKNRI